MSSNSGTHVNLEKFLIPLKEIQLATNDFSSENLIWEGQSSKVYKGTLSELWQYRTVAIKRHDKYYKTPYKLENELKMVSSLNHVNIVPFIGYYQNDREMILIFKYMNKGSLDHNLHRDRYSLTWAQRLKICIGAAKGLEYLHSGLGDDKGVIHRDFKTANILLDENLEAKVCGFDYSILVDPKQPLVHEHARGSLSYLDPVYHESGIVNTESDVYSFGVMLFEMLTGMLAYNGKNMDDVHPQTLINLVRNCYDDGLEKLIASERRNGLNIPSFHVFKEIAYKCISLKLDDRPNMSLIVKRFQEALAIKSHRAVSTIMKISNPYQNRRVYYFRLEEIELATGGFNDKFMISRPTVDRSLEIFVGQLSESWQNRRAIFKCYSRNSDKESLFDNEIEMGRKFDNENNILYFIGYRITPGIAVSVYEYAINGSLYDHLRDPIKRRCLTWTGRLKICIGAARGLKYLHSGIGEHSTKVIHRDIKSTKILLDEKMEVKISGFGMSVLVNAEQPQVYGSLRSNKSYVNPVYKFYMDPIYRDNGIIKTESDVYSFGVVLFEVLTGMLASDKRSIGDAPPQTLIDLVRRYYVDGGLDMLIDPFIRDEINIDSFQAFKKIASRCISLNIKDRPTMTRILRRIEEARNIQLNNGAASSITTRNQQLDSYLIPLKEIRLATEDFSRDTWRGEGGFGDVYKGQLSESWQNCTVAIKSLDTKGHQGYEEFHNELKLISSFHHENIIPFIGYCDEGNHMIIVTEYAVNHSLDHHLQDPHKRSCLTWADRLKICLGAARGLNYLHSNKVIHRDVKSANILLNKNMEAKICDFGLSKQSLKNQQATHIYTKAAGTNFYLDPFYRESGILREASDVYSFGVVLFEILSGMMAYTITSLGDGKPKPLINLVRQYYDAQPETLVDPFLKNKIDSGCFRTFKEIGYECISHIPKERPTMDIIVERIEDAMDFQGLIV